MTWAEQFKLNKLLLVTILAGQWSEWSTFSACSAICEGGVMVQCKRPVPSHASLPCPGSTTQVLACNTAPCGATILMNTLKTVFLNMKI